MVNKNSELPYQTVTRRVTNSTFEEVFVGDFVSAVCCGVVLAENDLIDIRIEEGKKRENERKLC